MSAAVAEGAADASLAGGPVAVMLCFAATTAASAGAAFCFTAVGTAAATVLTAGAAWPNTREALLHVIARLGVVGVRDGELVGHGHGPWGCPRVGKGGQDVLV